MATLTIGRVGADVTLTGPAQWSEQSNGTRTLTLEGDLVGSTLADTRALRDELAASKTDRTIPVTFDGDVSLDGFYRLIDVQVATMNVPGAGHVPFSVTLERVGTDADIVHRSILTTAVRANDHGIIAAESQPVHAPAGGHDAYSAVVGGLNRTSSDGVVRVYQSITDTRPTWTSEVANWYNGAATISTGGYVRAGLSTPNDLTTWILSNGLVRVTPNATGGRIDVEHYDGTQWETAKTWRVTITGADVGAWEWLSILRNDPEETTIRLQNSVTGGGHNTLDLTLTRGSRSVTGYVTIPTAASITIRLATGEAGATVTPTGATTPVAVDAAANDADGNRYIVGAAATHSSDTTLGGLSKSSVTELGFFVGSEIGGSSAVSGDTSADICLQYLGLTAETVRSLKR
jgi:hypothetical protein